MLDILKRMNNLQYIEQHQRICYLFSIFNLTCYKSDGLKDLLSLTLFKNIAVTRLSTLLRIFVFEDQDVPLTEELGEGPPHADSKF